MASSGTDSPTDSPTESPTKGELTRAAILRAAIHRFGHSGFRSTSVAAIARDADVGSTLAYAYFDNKEALFLAALDEDTAGIINSGVRAILESDDKTQWRGELMTTLIASLDDHPLAKRVLAGLEPHVTDRMIELPALVELRSVVAERLRADQAAGLVRPGLDLVAIANGGVTIFISLLMSVVQFGGDGVATYGSDVMELIDAAVRVER